MLKQRRFFSIIKIETSENGQTLVSIGCFYGWTFVATVNYNSFKLHKSAYYAQKAEICGETERIYHEAGGVLGHGSVRIFLSRKGMILSKTMVF